MRIASAGEILWDVFPDAERLGGAAFNFAVHAHRLGHDVRFISAVGNDDRGRRALAEMHRLGLATDFVKQVEHATGTVSVAIESGEPQYTIHRPAAYDFLEFDPPLIAFQPDWIYYGTLLSMNHPAAQVLEQILNSVPAKRFYDVNLRRNSFTPELVERLASAADAVKLNENELAELGWNLENLPAHYKCVTRGDRGCIVMIGDDRAECEAYPVQVADTVGAGDAFSAAFLHGIDQEWSAAKIGDFANRVAALIVSRAGAIPEWSLDEVPQTDGPGYNWG